MMTMTRPFSSVFVLCTFTFFGVLLTPESLQAAPGSGARFPYKAAVISAKAEILSGPGRRYYPTSELPRDAQVIVHRHDPGGWYMISPPQGSFSLVRTSYIKKETPKLGVVTQNHVVVRVASALNKHREVEQRRLMKGDRVQIIGEDKVDDRGRVLTMYRIEPPRGEFRWIKGDHLIPLDPLRRKAHDLDPFAVPSNAVDIDSNPPRKNTPDLKYPIAEQNKKNLASNTGASKNISLDKNTGAVESGPSVQELDRDRQILRALDRNFRTMIDKEISQWNIKDLTHDYKKLQSSTKIPAIANQVDLRLQAMHRYAKMKTEYDDLIKLTSATDRKDAELLSMQNTVQVASNESVASDPFPPFQTAQGSIDPFSPAPQEGSFLPDLGPTPDPNGSEIMIPVPEPDPNIAQSQFPPSWQNLAAQNGPGTPQPGAGFRNNRPFIPSAQQRAPQQQAALQFSGAGIVQRIDPQHQTGLNPQYALVSPSGRFLSYLHPAGHGVDLNRFIGHSIGVYGARQKDQRLGQDIIMVTGLAPVRLAPRQ